MVHHSGIHSGLRHIGEIGGAPILDDHRSAAGLHGAGTLRAVAAGTAQPEGPTRSP